MNQRSASERIKGPANERRSSLAATPGDQSSLSPPSLNKEAKRSLVAVLSEDQMASSNSNPLPAGQKQSFLSKFARSEVKTTKSVERAAGEPPGGKATNSQALASRKSFNTDTNNASNSSNSNESATGQVASGSRPQASSTRQVESSETQCDKTAAVGAGTSANNKQLPGASRTSKSFCEVEASQRGELKDAEQELEQEGGEEEDDNDQVLPVWPSKIEAAALKPSIVQHQVYSLKDYSQVAGPTESVPSSNVTSSSRLLKSMSQDRKVDTRSKRMSESILSGMSQGVLFMDKSVAGAPMADPTSRQRNPSVASKISGAELSSMGPAASVNSLLPPTKSNLNLPGESSFGRMRKLFVSPLSLRGAATSSASKSSSSAAPAAAYQPQTGSSNARLSFQGGAGMLNKPQHLMHAMYRGGRGPLGSHHSRRSPLRQKQKCQKGFRVYGCPLSMANTMYPITCFGRAEIYKQQAVPYILARLCNYIEENSSQLTHEGIFRVSGNARLMEKLKTLFDHLGDAPLESESVDVATSASMLKMYLRELPEPLISARMNHYFFSLAKKYSSCLSKSNPSGGAGGYSKTSDNLTSSGMPEASSISGDTQSSLDRQRVAFLRDLTKLIRKLPIENYNLLKYLTCFLHRVALKQHSNKMSAEALGIVFGPNVFRIRSESYKGLKEQELSNQIMASIISNYKLIFDCELTDPLGNLITSDASLAMPLAEQATSSSHAVSLAAGKKESGAADAIGVTRLKNVSPSPSSGPSTSAAKSCFKAGQQPKTGAIPEDDFYAGDTEDEDTDDEDEADVYDDADIDDFNDEDEDDCNDDSYSPSSGSGSYCSSLASESEESVYEGDIEQYEDEALMDSDTSSPCNSETSYTPSSSHSDSEPDELDEMSSTSNFGSSSSPTKELAAKENGAEPASMNAAAKNPCRVCKRRESRHLESLQASKLREQMALKVGEATTSASVGPDQDVGQNQLVEPEGEPQAAPEGPSEPSGKSRSRQSTRKRRSDESKRAAGSARKDAPASMTSTHTSSDLALDRRDAAGAAGQKPRSEDRSTIVKQQQLQQHEQSRPERQTHMAAALRRRSSSVSSLLRISERHGLRKRGPAVRDDYHHRSRAHADRKRYTNEPRAYSRKSKSRSHSHNVRPAAALHEAEAPPRASGSKMGREHKRADYYIPELIAVNLPSEVRKDLVWNYVSSSFLEVPEAERFYQLRSYNSDETLLRSQEAETELNNEANNNNNKNRRRFSGHEFLQTNNESLLSTAFPQFGEIFESFEAENSMEESRSVHSNEFQQSLFARSQLEGVESSAISLLGDQLTSIWHSTLSLDEGEDPIFLELRVTKDFIKVLRRLLKHGCIHGFDQEAFNYLIQVVGDLGSDNDDCTTCYVDHITGKRTAMTLDNLKRHFKEETARVDKATQDRLERLLSFTITNLKKRYINLRYIRDHYRKYHAKLDQTSPADEQQGVDKTTQKVEHENELAMAEISSNHQSTSQLGSAVKEPPPGDEDEDDALEKPKKARDHQTPDHRPIEGCSRGCKYGTLCPVEFVFNMEKQLASKRASGLRLVKLDDMTPAQIQSEKLELQKNLLRYEHWFGRPTTRAEFDLVGHLYERYRAIKIIKQRKQASAD